MYFLLIIFNLFMPAPQSPDPCADNHVNSKETSVFVKDSIFLLAVSNLTALCKTSANEFCISFGKDTSGAIIASPALKGGSSSGTVPAIAGAFADLHNHQNNLPPDAGDLFSLLYQNKKDPSYKTRFVVTSNGTLYALLVNNMTEALSFIQKHPPQPPAYAGGPFGFTAAITDEGRQMKYLHNCSDEMVLAFILEKYKTGLSLLKQMPGGNFAKLITVLNGEKKENSYSLVLCR